MKIIFTVCLQLFLLNTNAAANEADVNLDDFDVVEENESVFLYDGDTDPFESALMSVTSGRSNISGFRSRIMTNNVRAYDPINRKRYRNVILGQVYKSRNVLNGYTHWRYITVYNATRSSERVAYLPTHEEACYDDSFFFAEWGESRSITVTLDAKAGAEGLGLSASVGMSVSQGTTFSTNRRLKATLGVRAVHIPYKLSTTHRGITYIMVYDSKTRKHKYLTKGAGFDRMIGARYPYRFLLTNQDLGFKVKRKVIETCEMDESQASSQKGLDQWMPRP